MIRQENSVEVIEKGLKTCNSDFMGMKLQIL